MSIDFLFYLTLSIAFFKGFKKGFIVGVFSFLAFFIGLAAALKLSVLVAARLEAASGSGGRLLPIISFVIVFTIVVFLVQIGARILKSTVRLALLGWADKIGGILLYILTYTIIFSVLLFLGVKASIVSEEAIERSSTYNLIAPVGPVAIDGFGKVVPVFKNMFSELQHFFGEMGQRVAP